MLLVFSCCYILLQGQFERHKRVRIRQCLLQTFAAIKDFEDISSMFYLSCTLHRCSIVSHGLLHILVRSTFHRCISWITALRDIEEMIFPLQTRLVIRPPYRSIRFPIFSLVSVDSTNSVCHCYTSVIVANLFVSILVCCGYNRCFSFF